MFKKVNSLVLDPTAKILNFLSLSYARFLKSTDSEDNFIPCVELVDTKIMKSKRMIQNILTNTQDFYDFELNSSLLVSENFTVQDAVDHFSRFLPMAYKNTRYISKSDLSDVLSLFNAIFPQLDLFNSDYVDDDLYSFLFHCFNKIEFYYTNFQNQELLNNGVYMILSKEKGVLHLNNDKKNLSLYGGNVEGYFDLRIYSSFSRENSQMDTYDKLSYSRHGSIYDESEISLNVKYNTLQEYLDHYEKFSCMPLSFKFFMVLYKRALFAEFAKPFLVEVIKYLKENVSEKPFPESSDPSDDYLAMSAIDRFLLRF